MRRFAVSVPGKLILAGEHAVVHGYPALVAAVSRRLHVTAAEAPGRRVRIELPAIGWCGEASWEELRRLAEDVRHEWEQAYGGAARRPMRPLSQQLLAQIALGEAAATLPCEPPGLELRVESQLPVRGGLGSSAALAAGVVAALRGWTGLPTDAASVFPAALEVERRQHGLPSGADVAVALAGGVLWLRREPSGELATEVVASDSPLLGRLHAFDSGAPAEGTGELVAAVATRRAACPDRVESAFSAIADGAAELRGQLARPAEDSGVVVAVLRRCQAALEDLGVVPEAVRAAVHRIEAGGGAAKVSGAGSLHGPGAGCVVAYHPEGAAALVVPESWRPLAVTLGGPGLTVEPVEATA